MATTEINYDNFAKWGKGMEPVLPFNDSMTRAAEETLPQKQEALAIHLGLAALEVDRMNVYERLIQPPAGRTLFSNGFNAVPLPDDINHVAQSDISSCKQQNGNSGDSL